MQKGRSLETKNIKKERIILINCMRKVKSNMSQQDNSMKTL